MALRVILHNIKEKSKMTQLFESCDNCTIRKKLIDEKSDYSRIVNLIAEDVHDNAIKKGWWEKERNFGEMISLCHSELSELLEAIREGNKESKKISTPEVKISCAEEEIADTIIRLLDMARGCGLNIGKALVLKMEYNKKRPYKHGGKRF
jgi:NTP pyrophosphatase (non-canonical NTP hydrolase)